MSRASPSNSDTLVVPGLLALDVDRAIAQRQNIGIVDRADNRARERLPDIEGTRLVDDDGDAFRRRTFADEQIARVTPVRRECGPADNEADAQGEQRTTGRSLHLNSRMRDTIAEEKA